MLAGQYRTPKIYCEISAVFTNTAPVDAYRGAGRPEATYLLERIVETAAHEMGLDPAEIRRRNFITEFPYATPVGLTYDTGGTFPFKESTAVRITPDTLPHAGFDPKTLPYEGELPATAK